VAIVIRRFKEWDSGSFSGRRVLSDHAAVVDGLPARVQEVEITERNIAFAPGDRITEYVVELPDGAYLVAATYLGPDYGSARSVLDDMMRTMQIGSHNDRSGTKSHTSPRPIHRTMTSGWEETVTVVGALPSAILAW
jgi:hypothetical protein